jgi:Thioredoxin domain
VPGRHECQTCEETRELLEELVALSDRLHVTSHDVGEDPAAATLYNVEAVPTVIVRRRAPAMVAPGAAPADERIQATSSNREGVPAIPAGPSQAEIGANVRFLGLPGGYEFSTLLADIVDISRGRTDLSAEALDVVRSIDSAAHIQVFVTPT